MSSRRLLAVSALLLLAPAPLLVQPDVGSATEPSQTATTTASVSVRVTPHQRIWLEVLPQIVQHGGEVASPDRALAAITATVRPVRVSRRDERQRRLPQHMYVDWARVWETGS